VLIDLGTDKSKPLSSFRRKLLRLDERISCVLCLLSQGYWLHIKKSPHTSGEKPRIKVFNHTNIFDIAAMCITGCDCVISKEYVAKSPLTRGLLAATRSIILKKGARKASEIMEERYTKENGWPALVLFPEGTVSPKSIILR